MSQPYSVIIVDYLATQSAQRLKSQILSFQPSTDVQIIDAHKHKLGYGAALNKGMHNAQYDFVVCMNPDITLKNDALAMIVEQLRNDSRIGMCGPQISNEKGEVQITCSRIPTAWQALFFWSWLVKIGKSSWNNWYRLDGFDHLYSREVPALSGACFAVRKSDWQNLGGADENLFLYFEEFDFALRYQKQGLSLFFLSEAKITHFGQESTTKIQAVNKHFQRSRRYWLQKHFSLSGKIAATWLEFWEGKYAR